MVGRRRRAGALVVALVCALSVATAGPARSADDTVDEAVTTTADAGDTVRTDGASTVPTVSNPMLAAVTTPVAGDVTLTKVSEPAAVTGYDVLGEVTIDAPETTAIEPVHLAFEVDLSEISTGAPVASLELLHDGAAVPTCISAISASPDPCLLARSVSGDVLSVEALTSTASTWTAVRAMAERVVPASTTDAGGIAIAASRHVYPPGAADAVVLARVDDFADALAGTPLAARLDAPLLLTTSTELDDTTLDEITRVLPTGGTVYVLGGEAAVSSDVVTRLRSWGYTVVRYAGIDRYATAVDIAQRALGSPDVVVETTGANFADALAAGAVAARISGAVLLTNGADQVTATATYLRAHHPTRYAIGGPSTLADPGATPFAGRDRTETAVLAAREFFPSPTFLTFASGYTYTDAVTAAAYAAADGTPLLLLPVSGTLPIPVQIYLRELGSMRPTGLFVGSTTTLGADVVAAAAAFLG